MLDSTNALLQKVGIQSKIQSFMELKGSASSMFVAVFEKTFGVPLEDVMRKPVHVRDYVQNANIVIEALRSRIDAPLHNINGEAIVRGDATTILNLVSVFMEVVHSREAPRPGPGPGPQRPAARAAGRRPRPRRPHTLRKRRGEGAVRAGDAADGFLGRPPPPAPPAAPLDLRSIEREGAALRDALSRIAGEFEAPAAADGGGAAFARAGPGGSVAGGRGAGPDREGTRKLNAALWRMQREQEAIRRHQDALERRRAAAAQRTAAHQRKVEAAAWRRHAEQVRLQLLSSQLRRQNQEHVKLRQLYRAVLRSARQMRREEAAEGDGRAAELRREYEDLRASTAGFFEDRMALVREAEGRAREAQESARAAQAELMRKLLRESRASQDAAVAERMEGLRRMEESNLRTMREVHRTASALLRVDDAEADLEERFLAPGGARPRWRPVAAEKAQRSSGEDGRLRRLRRAYGS